MLSWALPGDNKMFVQLHNSHDHSVLEKILDNNTKR